MTNELIADGIYRVSGMETSLKNGAWVSDAGTYLVTNQTKLADIPDARPGDIAFTAGYSHIWQLDVDSTTWVELPKTAAGTAATQAAASATAAAGSASAAATSASQAQTVAASIPADYTELSNSVVDLKSALTEDENILLNIRELDITNEITPTMTSGLCSTDGTITASPNYEYTEILPVKAGDIIHCKATVLSGQTAPTDPCWLRFVTSYNGQTAESSAGESTGQTTSYTVPNGINGVRLTLNLQLYTSGSLVIYHETTEIEKSVKYEGLVSEVYGSNLIDKSLATNGAVQSDGSISLAGSFATYKTSAYIPVKATKTYTLYVADAIGLDNINETRLIYLLYDSNRQALTYANQVPVTNLTVSPTVDGYVRVCANDSETYPMFTNKLMLIEGTEYVPHEPYSVEKVLNDKISPINDKFLCNILKGKKWCPCGDSFTEYTNAKFTDGKYTGRDKTYPYLIALRNNMEIDARFFKSGRTIAYPADGTFTNSLTCPTNSGYYQNIPEDVDYVTIMLGINDCQHTGSGSTGDGEDATGVITLGTIDDTTTATYYGAYNTVLGWLRQNRPFAHVGVIVTNGTQLQDYTEAQINVAKKWGYPYINLNGDERTPAFIRCYNPNIPTSLKESLKVIQGVDAPSNTHPNWQTHELESTTIEAWLRTL